MLPLFATFLFSIQDPSTHIARLSAPTASERAAAAKELEAMGEAALRPLRTLRGETKDAELAGRVEAVIGGIELARPGGLMLVFTRGEAKACELWLWQDGVEVALTKNSLMECEPALSPDGSHLAYARTADPHDFGMHEIVVRDLTSGLETVHGKGRSPLWSPDGVHLAIARGKGIALRDLAKGAETLLAEGLGAKLASFAWSPNGRFLAVEVGAAIVILEAASGREVRRIASTPPGTSTCSSFSMGNDSLTLVAGNGPYQWDVFLASLREGEPRKLTQRSFRHGITALSPLETTALSLQSRHGEVGYAAFLLEIADGTQREVHPSASPLLQPTWSPEGRFVVFVDGTQQIVLLHVRSGRTRTLTKMGVGYGPATTWFAPAAWFAAGRALPKVKR